MCWRPETATVSVPLVDERATPTRSSPSVGGLAVKVVDGGSCATDAVPLPSTAWTQT